MTEMFPILNIATKKWQWTLRTQKCRAVRLQKVRVEEIWGKWAIKLEQVWLVDHFDSNESERHIIEMLRILEIL